MAIQRLRFKYRFIILRPEADFTQTYYIALENGKQVADDELSALLQCFGEKGFRLEFALPDGKLILQKRETINDSNH